MAVNKENFIQLAAEMRKWLDANGDKLPAEFDMASFARPKEDKLCVEITPQQTRENCDTIVCAAGFAAQCGIGDTNRTHWMEYVHETFFDEYGTLDDDLVYFFTFGGAWANHDNTLESAYHRILYVAQTGTYPPGWIDNDSRYCNFVNFRVENEAEVNG